VLILGAARLETGEALHDGRDDGRRCDIGACFACPLEVRLRSPSKCSGDRPGGPGWSGGYGARLVVIDAVRSLTQCLCRKSLCFALRRPVEEGDKLINDGAPIRLRSDVGGNQALGLDAERGFESGGSIDHGVSFGEGGAYWGIIALRA
jgi:hypothetical protein